MRVDTGDDVVRDGFIFVRTVMVGMIGGLDVIGGERVIMGGTIGVGWGVV